jgi:hypothetical protein
LDYVKGFVTKEQFSEALHAFQAAVDAMRSEQRDMAIWRLLLKLM